MRRSLDLHTLAKLAVLLLNRACYPNALNVQPEQCHPWQVSASVIYQRRRQASNADNAEIPQAAVIHLSILSCLSQPMYNRLDTRSTPRRARFKRVIHMLISRKGVILCY